MEPLTVLVIAEGAEATLLHAALARCEVRVAESPAERSVALAIAGAKALSESPDELVKRLEPRRIEVVGIAVGLSQKARKRALAAGVREIHSRPRKWRPYSELVQSVVERFARKKP